MRTKLYCIIVKLCNRSSDIITHMAVKIAVSREFEDEKRHVHSDRLLLFLMQKKLTALSDIFCKLLEVMHLTDYCYSALLTWNQGATKKDIYMFYINHCGP